MSIGERIKGYRTVIVGALIVVYAALQMAGLDGLPNPDGEETMGLMGALMILLRFVTSGSVGQK